MEKDSQSSQNLRHIDTCLLALGRRGLIGATAGFFVSLIVAKRRVPFICYGAGLGMGMSYFECELAYQQIWNLKSEKQRKQEVLKDLLSAKVDQLQK